MTIVELKQEYNKQLGIVKDDKNGKIVRTDAYKKLESIYPKIKYEEPNTLISTPKEIHDKFIGKLELQDVIWPEYDKSFWVEELNALEEIRKIAYHWVKKNHPILNDQTDKFGQIVNARMQIIIAFRQ